jgi:hypothetical protein
MLRNDSRFIHQISSETPEIYQNYLARRNTADVTGGKPIVVWLHRHLILGGSVVNPLFTIYDIHRSKREGLFFYSVSDTTRDTKLIMTYNDKFEMVAQTFDYWAYWRYYIR